MAAALLVKQPLVLICGCNFGCYTNKDLQTPIGIMKTIHVKEAPDAIGPYCHAMKSGNLVFCSGQTPLDPKTMKLVGTTIEDQTKRVLNNLSIVLSGAGLTLQDVVKTTVYLKNMDDFKGMNRVYEEMFNGHKPSRTTISVKQNPLDVLVEIECIAELR
jgi:2-iminobutanoate/2-iminopropanoate deaminase